MADFNADHVGGSIRAAVEQPATSFPIAPTAVPDLPGPAPAVSWVSPSPGTTIRRTDPITVAVEDSDVALLILSARYPGQGVEEVVYRAGRFADSYQASTVQVVGDTTTFTLRRTGGWLGAPTIQVDVVDADGQTA